MLSSICRGKAAAGIFLLKPRSKTSGNGGYITGVFWAAAYTAYTVYIFLRFQKFHTTANTGIRQMNKTSAYLKQTMLFWQTRVKMKIDPVCEKNYPLPLNVPNVPYIP